MIDGSPTEFWSSDERRILTLAQDVVHCATEARAILALASVAQCTTS